LSAIQAKGISLAILILTSSRADAVLVLSLRFFNHALADHAVKDLANRHRVILFQRRM
jgi:hypothetical protein